MKNIWLQKNCQKFSAPLCRDDRLEKVMNLVTTTCQKKGLHKCFKWRISIFLTQRFWNILCAFEEPCSLEENQSTEGESAPWNPHKRYRFCKVSHVSKVISQILNWVKILLESIFWVICWNADKVNCLRVAVQLHGIWWCEY